jgi:hypothetical protein
MASKMGSARYTFHKAAFQDMEANIHDMESRNAAMELGRGSWSLGPEHVSLVAVGRTGSIPVGGQVWRKSKRAGPTSCMQKRLKVKGFAPLTPRWATHTPQSPFPSSLAAVAEMAGLVKCRALVLHAARQDNNGNRVDEICDGVAAPYLVL